MSFPPKISQRKELKDNKRVRISKRLMNRSKPLLTRKAVRSQNQPNLPRRAVL